jgi:hypothetical protein
MSLKALCIKNMIEQIKNLPPVLLEEVIGESLKAIKEEAKAEVIKEMKASSSIVIDDITERIIKSSQTGRVWERPEYTKDIDDELYYTFVDISEQFINKHGEKLIFKPFRRHDGELSDEYESDSDSEIANDY